MAKRTVIVRDGLRYKKRTQIRSSGGGYVPRYSAIVAEAGGKKTAHRCVRRRKKVLRRVIPWLENWEGATITSNHPWQNLSPTGAPCSGPDVIQYNFGDEKIVKIESIVAASGGCVCAPEVDLRYSPEQPLNLKNYSGFECKAYLAEFEPRTFTKTFCNSHCWKDVEWIVWGDITLDLGWRLVGSSALYDFWASYGFLFYQGCKWNSDTKKCDYFGLDGWDTFDELIARVETWSNLTEFTTGYIAGPPWGNGDYELSWISPYIRLYLSWDAYALHGTTSMKVYFSDIVIS